jgi:hypothetical protein
MKKKPIRKKAAKSNPTLKRRSSKVSGSPLDVFGGPPWHHWQLMDLAPQIGKAAEQLAIHRRANKALTLPAEKLLSDVIFALKDFRSISKRGPNASLMTLAREADEMWEGLRLSERLERLATNLEPRLIKSPREALDSGSNNLNLGRRLSKLLRRGAKAEEKDLEMLIPLIPEETQKDIGIIRQAVQSPHAQSALARLCTYFLHERNADYSTQQRLLTPLFKFFLELNDKHLLRKAGFISKAEVDEMTALRKVKNARERQRRHRSKKRTPSQA